MTPNSVFLVAGLFRWRFIAAMTTRKILVCIFLVPVFCLFVWHLTGTSGPPAQADVPNSFGELYVLHTSNSSPYIYPVKSLAYDDYSQLIDIHNFTFITVSSVCSNETVFLLVLIHSSPENYLKRKTIRETWGSPRAHLRILFMLGEVKEKRLQSFIHKESSLHGDIVQGKFIDAYRNMTYKHIMSLKYAIYHCPQAKYVLKTDDDVFVNMPIMIDFLKIILSPEGTGNLLLCETYTNAMVLRSYRSKWRVSFKEYPFRVYPTYCMGYAILYSPDVIFALYREAYRHNYFWIDDVHVTGTLVRATNAVTHTDIKSLLSAKKDIYNLLVRSDNSTKGFLYGKLDLKECEIRALWNFVSDHD